MKTQCGSLCCQDDDCPCGKMCDETYCDVHLKEEEKYWKAYFGLNDKMSKQERKNQLEAFRPVNYEKEY